MLVQHLHTLTVESLLQETSKGEALWSLSLPSTKAKSNMVSACDTISLFLVDYSVTISIVPV